MGRVKYWREIWEYVYVNKLKKKKKRKKIHIQNKYGKKRFYQLINTFPVNAALLKPVR